MSHLPQQVIITILLDHQPTESNRRASARKGASATIACSTELMCIGQPKVQEVAGKTKKKVNALEYLRVISHEIEVGSAAGGQLVEKNKRHFSALVALALGQGYPLELRRAKGERKEGRRMSWVCVCV